MLRVLRYSAMEDNLIESYKHKYGPLPVSVKPIALRRLLGFSVFTLDADYLEIHNGKEKIKLPYAQITDLSINSGKILINTADQNHIIKTTFNNREIFPLLQKLVVEDNRFRCFMADASADNLETDFEFFAQMLSCIAVPYVRASEVLLHIAEKWKFSDVHFEPIGYKVKISFRQTGTIRALPGICKHHYQRLLARLKYLSGCLSHILDIPQEGACKINNVDLRLSTFPADHGERLSLRIIRALAFPDITSLGWSQEDVLHWRCQIMANPGLYIISGPVGSGKTTAMYATLSELANRDEGLRVVTIEDPVEAKIPGICQSSLENMQENDLSAAFKHMLRQDPDLIALGEIRDRTSVREVLQAALSGHLILATFHAGSPDEAQARIRQMGIEDYLVLSGLKGVVHLNLIKNGDKMEPRVTFSFADYNKEDAGKPC